MCFLTTAPKDIWYIISKFLTFEQILLISLFHKTPYPESSYVFREFYEQEIGRIEQNGTEINYSQETIQILKDIKEFSPEKLLDYSIKNRYLGLFKTSISKGVNLTDRNILYQTIVNGHLEIVKYLLNHLGESAFEAIKSDNYIPIRVVIHGGQIEKVKYLASYLGESFIGAIKYGNYACLLTSMLLGNLEMVKYLVDCLGESASEGIKANSSFYLRWVKDEELVKYLLSKGANREGLSEEQQRFYSS